MGLAGKGGARGRECNAWPYTSLIGLARWRGGWGERECKAWLCIYQLNILQAGGVGLGGGV